MPQTNTKKLPKTDVKPQRRTGEQEIQSFLTLYTGAFTELQNRRIVDLGIQGMAVIYDDPGRAAGHAVVSEDGKNRLANITKAGTGYEDEQGPVQIKGWVHTLMHPVETPAFNWTDATQLTLM